MRRNTEIFKKNYSRTPVSFSSVSERNLRIADWDVSYLTSILFMPYTGTEKGKETERGAHKYMHTPAYR